MVTKTRWGLEEYKRLIDVWHDVSGRDGTVKDVAETLNLTRAQVLSRRQTLRKQYVELPDLKREPGQGGMSEGDWKQLAAYKPNGKAK